MNHPASDAGHQRRDGLAGQQLDRPDGRRKDRLEGPRLLLADDAEGRDRERDVGRHQQEEHEELLDRERAGELARREGGPLRSLEEDLRSELLGERPFADRTGQRDRGDGQDQRRDEDRREQQAVADHLDPLPAQDRPHDAGAHQVASPPAPGWTPMTSK